jgi:hypothetical protein
MTTKAEMQEAADRGELVGFAGSEKVRRQVEANERRWIVMQVKDIAVHQQLTPEQFKDLCEYIRQFTAADVSSSASDPVSGK